MRFNYIIHRCNKRQSQIIVINLDLIDIELVLYHSLLRVAYRSNVSYLTIEFNNLKIFKS